MGTAANGGGPASRGAGAVIDGAPGGAPGRERRPAARRLGLVAAALVVAAGYSQWTALPWLPPWVVPALAAAGGGLSVWSLGDAVRRAVRRHRAGGRVPVVPLAVSAVAVTLFAVLPLTRLSGALATPAPGAPRVLSGFRAWLGAEGYPRLEGRHSGVDLAGRPGTAVLAPADGRVVVAADQRDSCGLTVVLEHEPAGYRTIHCHLSAIAVAPGDAVRRGDRIGAVGTSGMRAWPGYEHVRWELRRGRTGPREDPLARTAGCFDPSRAYPADRLVLTYPVPC